MSTKRTANGSVSSFPFAHARSRTAGAGSTTPPSPPTPLLATSSGIVNEPMTSLLAPSGHRGSPSSVLLLPCSSGTELGGMKHKITSSNNTTAITTNKAAAASMARVSVLGGTARNFSAEADDRRSLVGRAIRNGIGGSAWPKSGGSAKKKSIILKPSPLQQQQQQQHQLLQCISAGSNQSLVSVRQSEMVAVQQVNQSQPPLQSSAIRQQQLPQEQYRSNQQQHPLSSATHLFNQPVAVPTKAQQRTYQHRHQLLLLRKAVAGNGVATAAACQATVACPTTTSTVSTLAASASSSSSSSSSSESSSASAKSNVPLTHSSLTPNNNTNSSTSVRVACPPTNGI